MSNVRDILKTKGGLIWSVSPTETVKHTLQLMAEKNIGALLVMDGKAISGIFSERDFARHCAKRALDPEKVLIKEMMTTNLVMVHPEQSTDECMTLMTTKRIRHLPVIENNELVGLISIGDVVNRIIQDHKFSIGQLMNYVHGP